MLNPIPFALTDFFDPAHFSEDEKMHEYQTRAYKALELEDLSGADLVDNLILLRFLENADIQDVLKTKYNMMFLWLNFDPTPAELKPLAERYNIFLQRETDYMVVYVPLGTQLDDASLSVDIPNYRFRYAFIADCNYRAIVSGRTTAILSYKLADFRPLLVMRRIILDCIWFGSTDIHFASTFVNKVPCHRVQYRITKALNSSEFQMDYDMMTKVMQKVVGDLTSASAADLMSSKGVVTNASDLFLDGGVDLRITGVPDEAGIYCVSAVQTTRTTGGDLDQLGFPKTDVMTLRDIARRRTGLTLVTGEMRTGKNTTIFAMINEIAQQPIRIVEYSNPIENRMDIIQFNYKGEIDRLLNYLKMAKKMDIDIAVINEIPDASVAFAVRDLVNSAIGVFTTTHVNRVWHVPMKLLEFYGKDYKTVLSQLNAVVNHKMFRKWKVPNLQKRMLNPNAGPFEQFAYRYGVRQYFVPPDGAKVVYSYQPLVEILILSDEMKSAMLNFDEVWRAEQMIRSQVEGAHGTIESKLAQYINEGLCSLEEMKSMY